MVDNLKYKFQKGLSLVEGMTAAAILGASITVFMTLQSTQEQDFSTLRKFDKAAYAVELMFEELAAVYQPIASQYGNPQVAEDTTAGTSLKAKGFNQLPDVGDEITITGVGGKYEITARSAFDADQNTTLTLDRSDIADDNVVNMASDAIKKAKGVEYFKGVGELPFIQQATVSIWKDEASINMFAYKNKNHSEIIRKTKRESWYREDMFTRFELIGEITN